MISVHFRDAYLHGKAVYLNQNQGDKLMAKRIVIEDFLSGDSGSQADRAGSTRTQNKPRRWA